jgi:hypothetical protein
MKNIHVLKTSKPSKLLKDLVDKTYQFKKEVSFGNRIELPLNIYITSDEEIKEGDWFMSDFNSFPIHNIKELSEREGTLGWEQKDLKNNLKIILTTDQDLIKDGVQAIDNEFLEWFVKNPSCESVEVKIWFDTSHISLGIGKVYHSNPNIPLYKIIIPKEEPKQKCIATKLMHMDSEIAYKSLPKKETPFKHECEVLPKEYIMENRSNAYEFIDFDKQETLEDKLKLLVEEWQERQEQYVDIAYKNVDNAHAYRKFAYKAMATRDCWKELLKLIEDEK